VADSDKKRQIHTMYGKESYLRAVWMRYSVGLSGQADKTIHSQPEILLGNIF
jgi:hypothetical protein